MPRRAALLALACSSLSCGLGGADYSSQWGADATADTTADAPAEAAVDAGVDAKVDALTDAPPAETGCACTANQECVAGKCQPCAASWSRDHKALSQRWLRNIDQYVDRTKGSAYVGAARTDDKAYLAEVGLCLGNLRREWSAPVVGGRALPGLTAGHRRGNELVFQTQGVTTGKLGSIVRFDALKNDFSAVVDVDAFAPEAVENQPWILGVAPSGKIYLGGDYPTPGATTRTPYFGFSDGAKSCSKGLTASAGYYGRPLAFAGDDVFYVLSLGAELRVLRYSDAACNVGTCACEPVAELPKLTLAKPFSPFAAKVVGSTLVVAGFSDDGAGTQSAAIVQYTPATGSWGTAWIENTSPLIDAFLALDTDGSYVYAGLTRNYSFSGDSVSTVEVLTFALPISQSSAPKRLAMPKLSAVWGVSVDGAGSVIATGRSADTLADGRTVKCPLAGCP